MVIGPQARSRGDDPAPVIGQLFGHPGGAFGVTKGEPEASFDSSAWAKSTEWSHLSAVRAAGSELRASSRLPPAAQIRARSSWAKYSKLGRAR